MIAPELLPQRAASPPLRRDRLRLATRRRARHARRRLHAPVVGVLVLALAVLTPLLAYVWLTANVTSQAFALAHAEHDRTSLQEQTQRLDDRIARLQSPERLAALAAGLKLHDPHVYAVVRVPVPKPQPQPTGIALFAGWFAR